MTPLQAQIIETHNAHPDLNQSQIATLCDVHHAHVGRTLQQFGITLKSIKAFKENRANIFAGLQHKLLSSLTLSDIKRTPVAARVVSAGILYDKERLERGQSTVNQMQIIADIAAIKGLKSVS